MPPLPHATSIAILAATLLAGCGSATKTSTASKAKQPSAETRAVMAATTEALTGRWILSPGDCHMPATETPTEEGSLVSPAGTVLTLGAAGGMTSRQGDFIRRGTWKFDGTTLRVTVEPPPRRLDMGFVPVLESDRLTLQGADEMVLVYHRDPFIAVERVP